MIQLSELPPGRGCTTLSACVRSCTLTATTFRTMPAWSRKFSTSVAADAVAGMAPPDVITKSYFLPQAIAGSDGRQPGLYYESVSFALRGRHDPDLPLATPQGVAPDLGV